MTDRNLFQFDAFLFHPCLNCARADHRHPRSTASQILLKSLIVVAVMLSNASIHAQPAIPQTKPAKFMVAYVPNWIDLAPLVDTIDYGKLTHINIAFENPINDSGDLSFNPKNDALIARAHAHQVLVLMSIGGGSASEDQTQRARYASLIGASKRARFVANIVDYLNRHHLDGLDVDIEGPAINGDFGAFIHDLRVALTASSPGKLLTSALSKGYGGAKVPNTVFADLDFVNIMAYDATGNWNPDVPGQHSSFEFARNNVEYWLKRGLPASKAVLGVPFYGYGFGKAFRKGDYPYSEIVKTYLGAENLDQVGQTIWYNGVPTIRAKAQYVRSQNLAGVMIWSLDYDVKGKLSLLDAIYNSLK